MDVELETLIHGVKYYSNGCY